MTLSQELALLAIATTADVFTPEGDAVVIERLTGAGGLAIVNGARHDQVRYPLDALEASRSLLDLAAREQPPVS